MCLCNKTVGPWLTRSRTVCQKNLESERRRLARVVEEMPKRFVKQKEPKDGISDEVQS